MSEGKILLLEDNKFVSKIWQNLLEKEGFEVILTGTGEAAINEAKKECPDVIILDIVVPEGHGFQVLQTLRLFDETKNTPVLFLTGLNRESDRRRADELGAAGYFIKSPTVAVELIKEIKNCIAAQTSRA